MASLGLDHIEAVKSKNFATSVPCKLCIDCVCVWVWTHLNKIVSHCLNLGYFKNIGLF